VTQAKAVTKKERIIEVARALGKDRYTAAEIEQIRRQLIVHLGGEGKTSSDYIASVLDQAGLRVILSPHVAATERYEEEFQDLLHFSTIEEAEMCIVRLDELLRKFQTSGENSAVERVREVGRLGRRRAEMIAHNQKVDANKRAEKEEKRKRSPTGLPSGWRLPTPFSTGWRSGGSRPIFSSASATAPLTRFRFEPPGSGAPRPRPWRKGNRPGIN
jgi:hypothetical protein